MQLYEIIYIHMYKNYVRYSERYLPNRKQSLYYLFKVSQIKVKKSKKKPKKPKTRKPEKQNQNKTKKTPLNPADTLSDTSKGLCASSRVRTGAIVQCRLRTCVGSISTKSAQLKQVGPHL